jgi:DNA-binding MarR family transcriptional regulator
MEEKQENIVQLVNEYHKYSQKENGGIEGFCQSYLASKQEVIKSNLEVSKVKSTKIKNSELGKLLGRISRFAKVESYRRLPEIGLDSFEDVLMISLIGEMNLPTKKEIIDHSMIEYTTGIEVLKRLHKRKLTTESVNPEDKRSKIVKLNSKGKKAHLESHTILEGLSDHMFFPLNEEDKKQLNEIFQKLDAWHTNQKNNFLDKNHLT